MECISTHQTLTYHTMNTASYATHISQSERLALCDGRTPLIMEDIGPDLRTVSAPPNGFRMPSMSRVREHDALLSLYGSNVNVSDEEADEDEDEESELREHAYAKRMDVMREHSFRLPSQRSRRDVTDTLASMGMGYND